MLYSKMRGTRIIRMFNKGDFLRFLLTPSHIKCQLLSKSDKEKFKKINTDWNTSIYTLEKGTKYDEQHKYSPTGYINFVTEFILTKLFKEKRNETVLEIGAGTGYYTIKYAQLVKSVDAVELGKDLIASFRLKLKQENLKNISIINKNIYDLNSSKKYDTILFISTLHHIPFRLELFKQLTPLLKKEGRIILIEPHHNVFRKFKLFRDYLFKYRKMDLSNNMLLWGGHDFISFEECNYYASKLNLYLSRYFTFRCWPLFFIKNNEVRKTIELFIGSIPVIKRLQNSIVIVFKK